MVLKQLSLFIYIFIYFVSCPEGLIQHGSLEAQQVLSPSRLSIFHSQTTALYDLTDLFYILVQCLLLWRSIKHLTLCNRFDWGPREFCVLLLPPSGHNYYSYELCCKWLITWSFPQRLAQLILILCPIYEAVHLTKEIRLKRTCELIYLGFEQSAWTLKALFCVC